MQKTPTPDISDLPAPPFESEYKAGSASKLKTQNVTVVEAGTSVVPRQRPRGIALGLPPSPSPRNTTSPQPQMFCSELFQSSATTEQKLTNSFADDSQEGILRAFEEFHLKHLSSQVKVFQKVVIVGT